MHWQTIRLEQALALAKRATFFRIHDIHRDAYAGHVDSCRLLIERIPTEKVLSGGYGLEIDNQFAILVEEHGIVLCKHVFSEREFAGFGADARFEYEGDARVRELFNHVRKHAMQH